MAYVLITQRTHSNIYLLHLLLLQDRLSLDSDSTLLCLMPQLSVVHRLYLPSCHVTLYSPVLFHIAQQSVSVTLYGVTFLDLVAEEHDLITALGTARAATQSTDVEIVNQL